MFRVSLKWFLVVSISLFLVGCGGVSSDKEQNSTINDNDSSSQNATDNTDNTPPPISKIVNYLTNPSAENGVVGWSTFGGGSALKSSTNQAHTGSSSFLSSDRTQYYHGASTDIKPLVDDGNISNGKRYTFSVWVYHSQSSEKKFSLNLKRIDSRGTKYITIDSPNIAPNQWCRVTKHFVLDVDSALSGLELYLTTSSGETFDFYSDDFFLGELEDYTPPSSSEASSFIRAKGAELVVGALEESIILKGINIATPNDASDEVDDIWNTKAISLDDFQKIKDMGFNAIRLNMYYKIFEDDSSVGVYREDGWHWLDRAIGYAKEVGLYIMLDMHAPQGGYQSDKSKGFIAFWDKDGNLPNTDNQTRLINLWGAIANRYKHEDTILGYDLINEPRPNDSSEWFDYASQIIDKIRVEDSNHLIVLEAPFISGYTMQKMSDDNILYDSHFYTTWDYATQYSNQYGNSGQKWGTYSSISPIYLDSSWSVVWTPQSGGTPPTNSKPFDKSFLEEVLREDILEFANTHSVPVNIGEYGIVHEAFKESIGALDWMSDVHKIFEGDNDYNIQMSSFYYNYQGTTFGIYHNWSGFETNEAEINSELRDFFVGMS